MDLNTVVAVKRPTSRAEVAPFQAGDAWLAGGTWLFSEPQPQVRRLIDLSRLQWPDLEAGESGLTVAATCPVAVLSAFEAPPDWIASPLILQCCRAFLASFKIWTMATVGGNLCMALPAGPMISLAVALDAECLIWTPDGGERRIAAADFVLGPQRTVLTPGELLRSLAYPRSALRRRTAFRKISLSPLARSAALLIGTRERDGAFRLTITASTRHPVSLSFDGMPSPAELAARLDEAIPASLYYDDVHGAPAWRQHMTRTFAAEIRAELA